MPPLFLPCAVSGCPFPRTHATVAHHCVGCRRHVGDDAHSCPVRIGDENGDFGEATSWWPHLTRVHAALRERAHPSVHFACFYAGMACTWTVFIGDDDICRAVFLHSDHQGQYDVNLDDTDLVRWAERGRTQLMVAFPWDEEAEVVLFDDDWGDDDHSDDGLAQTATSICPLCRTPVAGNYPVTATEVEKADNECVVCLASPVGMKLPACGHACLCEACAARWGPRDVSQIPRRRVENN